jgi:hypothetical protein
MLHSSPQALLSRLDGNHNATGIKLDQDNSDTNDENVQSPGSFVDAETPPPGRVSNRKFE